MLEKESHLFQTPKYVSNNIFVDDFASSLKNIGEEVNIDISAIQSFLSFGYLTGDRTLLKEVATT